MNLQNLPKAQRVEAAARALLDAGFNHVLVVATRFPAPEGEDGSGHAATVFVDGDLDVLTMLLEDALRKHGVEK